MKSFFQPWWYINLDASFNWMKHVSFGLEIFQLAFIYKFLLICDWCGGNTETPSSTINLNSLDWCKLSTNMNYWGCWVGLLLNGVISMEIYWVSMWYLKMTMNLGLYYEAEFPEHSLNWDRRAGKLMCVLI